MLYKVFYLVLSSFKPLILINELRLLILFYLALIIYLTIKYSKLVKETKNEENIRHTVFILLFISLFSYKAIEWFNGSWNLPLNICTISCVMSLILLLNKNKNIFDIVFFTGIVGAIITFISLENGYYRYDNIHFYKLIFEHTMILVIPLYFKFGYGYSINKESLLKSSMVLIIMWLINFFINSFTRTLTTLNTNYMYTHELPNTLKGILPDWPFYIFIFGSGVISLYIVIYFIFRNKKIKIKQNETIKMELQ